MLKGAQQLKHVVEEKSLLGNFTKEHDKFVTEKRTQQRREEAAVPPWVGYVEEEEMKKAILALSKVRLSRNLSRPMIMFCPLGETQFSAKSTAGC